MSSSSANPPTSPLKIAVIGDIHEQWDDHDVHTLLSLQPDVAVFVGDIGNENVDLVRSLSAIPINKAIILGNHDAWYSLTSRGRQRALKIALMSSSLKNFQTNNNSDDDSNHSIRRMLTALGRDHIGYSARYHPEHNVSLVGGRPFSKGGSQWSDVASFYQRFFKVDNHEDSTQRIVEAALAQPIDASLVMVAHNGPVGLGGERHSPCGIDWMTPVDDFGDPDLEEAIYVLTKEYDRRIALVLFGHMHHTLKGGGLRDMAYVDPGTGTVYLNAAVVPRWRKESVSPVDNVSENGAVGADGGSGNSSNSSSGGATTGANGSSVEKKERHFLMVTMDGGEVIGASHVWANGARIVSEQEVIKVAHSQDDGGRKRVVSYFRAHVNEWVPVVMES